MRNRNLLNAKKRKNDEFYTTLSAIEKEMSNYTGFFEGKVVYCNCDDYRVSNFIKYFKNNFHILGIKKLLASNYDIGAGAYCYEFAGEEITIKELEGSGDFRSAECIEFLKEADVVVTNPPFSLFREYVKQLMDYGKKFIIIGNKNSICCKEIFPYIKNNQLWIGNTPMGYDMKFILPEHYAKEVMATKKEGSGYVIKDGKVMGRAQAIWYTNVEHKKRNTPLDLYKRYSNEYPKYDNYDAIECGKVAEIPMDYDGVVGVPITFIDKYCPAQFEIVGIAQGSEEMAGEYYLGIVPTIKYDGGKARPYLNGKALYPRILIRKRTA